MKFGLRSLNNRRREQPEVEGDLDFFRGGGDGLSSPALSNHLSVPFPG